MIARAAILALWETEEALVLRAVFEALGIDVQLMRAGRPSDLLGAFCFYGRPADLIVFSAHGDEKGFIAPEMAPGVDPMPMPGNRIGLKDLESHLGPVQGPVLSTACASGRADFAHIFLERGAPAYIAPKGDPDGRDIAFFVHSLVHGLCRSGLSLQDALTRANAALSPEDRFGLWS